MQTKLEWGIWEAKRGDIRDYKLEHVENLMVEYLERTGWQCHVYSRDSQVKHIEELMAHYLGQTGWQCQDGSCDSKSEHVEELMANYLDQNGWQCGSRPPGLMKKPE